MDGIRSGRSSDTPRQALPGAAQARRIEAAPGIEAKRALLKAEDANFLTKLGVEGERMQSEVDALLATLPAEEASAFLLRIAG